MRLTMCARGECPMCKYEEQCDNWDFRMELATKNMNILADALRKTEPTISKMEQVEDETRLTAKCLNCANGGSYKCSKCDGEMYFKDEPQTDCLTCRYNSDEWDSPKCDSCSKAHSNYAPQTDCSWK